MRSFFGKFTASGLPLSLRDTENSMEDARKHKLDTIITREMYRLNCAELEPNMQKLTEEIETLSAASSMENASRPLKSWYRGNFTRHG